MRVTRLNDTVEIQVCMIEWSHPHTPKGTWHPVEKLDKCTPQEVIDDLLEKTLRDRHYFKVCNECDQRNPSGHMHSNNVCQSCAEENHGVVH